MSNVDLRSRILYYLTENFAVPLIMPCQRQYDFKFERTKKLTTKLEKGNLIFKSKDAVSVILKFLSDGDDWRLKFVWKMFNKRIAHSESSTKKVDHYIKVKGDKVQFVPEILFNM